jgi:hypothetical protein
MVVVTEHISDVIVYYMRVDGDRRRWLFDRGVVICTVALPRRRGEQASRRAEETRAGKGA